MLCLGIESTAHTFGCSVVDSRGNMLSDARDVYKAPEGSGIHPREASRHHMEVSPDILKNALKSANVTMKDIDIVGYSAGPGLGPCLRVGAVVARTIAGFYKKPLVPVNHALGHIELGAILTGASDPLVLLVSGGHTMLLAFSHSRWRVFGETLDITVGQLIDQFASQSAGKYLQLPYIIKGNDVSFSGLLTAAVKLASCNTELADTCYSLQETAFAMLAEAVERALSFTSKKEMMIVGGVAANKRLAEMLESVCSRQDAKLFVCPIKFAGDNGAQIAWTALQEYLATKINVRVEESTVQQSWRLDTVHVSWRR